jgi:DNA-directed RNA polymerase specialized sigma24 family protein
MRMRKKPWAEQALREHVVRRRLFQTFRSEAGAERYQYAASLLDTWRLQGKDPFAELEKVLRRLPETQRNVLELRMGLKDGHPHDLADTARTLGLSMSEARDIEQRAFEHIREAIPLQQLQRFLDR